MSYCMAPPVISVPSPLSNDITKIFRHTVSSFFCRLCVSHHTDQPSAGHIFGNSDSSYQCRMAVVVAAGKLIDVSVDMLGRHLVICADVAAPRHGGGGERKVKFNMCVLL